MSSNMKPFYAQIDSETKHDPGDTESNANALLTFADMVLALDTAHDTCDTDHTYAGYESEESAVQILEAEILIQKEKDHPYAFSGRWKGRPPNSSRTSQPSKAVPFASKQRSSSEENLFRSVGTTDRQANGADGLSARKCHSYEKVFMHDSFGSTSSDMFASNFQQHILHGAKTIHDTTTLSTSKNELLNIPLSSSLPVEDNTIIISEKLAMDIDPPEIDHTYARAKSKSDKLNKTVISKQFHTQEKDGGHKSDHTYHDKLSENPFLQVECKQQRPDVPVLVTAVNPETCDKLQTSDHTYYTCPRPKQKQTHPSGTVGPINKYLPSFLFTPQNDKSDHNYSTTA